MDERQTKGEGMINNGIKPIIVDTENFLMPSASNPAKKYHVQRGTAWKCECPDFQYRGVICKHIHATSLFLKVRAKVTETSETQIKFAEQENELDEYSCQFCDSANIRKDGIRKNKIRVVQRFKCLDCKKRFVCEPIKFLKCDTKIICLVMDLYYKGLSLRDVKDTLQQFYGFDIHHETIRRWIRKFSRILNEYTNKLSPQVSSSWNADEQMIPTKKHNDFIYTWNVLDNQTRYLLASRATPTRDKWDAYEVMKLAGENAKLRPSLVTTDKNPSYGIGIHKAFNFKKKADRVMHRSILGHRRYFNNNVIERYHSQFREFDKVRRGINQVQDYTDGHRVFHNFIRKQFDGKTPAERAKLEIVSEAKNKWEKLLCKSLKSMADSD